MPPRREARDRRRPTGGRRPPAAPETAPPLSLRHPATLAVALVVAACVVVSTSAWIYDSDFWHHLLVGRVIWETHRIPIRQLWNWSTYGSIDANNAWLFRMIVWPLWSAWGLVGLYAWRWASSLAVFGISWAAARRMGARGFTPLVVIAACVLVYRQRSQIRPETLVSVLMALQIWILEGRRQARVPGVAAASGPRAVGEAHPTASRDHALWLIPIAWVWANTHPSYYMGFVMIGFHLLDDLWIARRGSGAAALAARAGFRRLLVITLAAVAISFANPWTWRSLWQPFEFFFTLRHEALYQGIGELQHIDWRNNSRNGLAVMLVLWPLLALWRWRRQGGFDRVETLCLLFFTALMLNTQRFTGAWAVAAAPYLGRDLDAWVRSRRWPAWSRPAWTRAALAATACVALSVPEWLRVEYPIGIRLDQARYPIVACDFMAAHGVRGRGFNDLGGAYVAWRFWPERERLPFITGTLETVTPVDRNLYTMAQKSSVAWRELDARHHFDYALVSRYHGGWGALLDFLDADTTTWALVFADDAAALYVRRDGPLDSLVAPFAYHWIPAGSRRLGSLGRQARADLEIRREAEAELIRQTRESPFNSQANSLLAASAMTDGRLADARRYAEATLAVDPLTPGEHERLGLIALAERRPADALAEFRSESRLVLDPATLDVRFGQAYAALGDPDRARKHLNRALERDPQNAEARAALAGLAGRGGS
jgi:hypothetical protein